MLVQNNKRDGGEDMESAGRLRGHHRLPEEEPEEEREQGREEHPARQVAQRVLVLRGGLLRRRVCLHTGHTISAAVLPRVFEARLTISPGGGRVRALAVHRLTHGYDSSGLGPHRRRCRGQ